MIRRRILSAKKIIQLGLKPSWCPTGPISDKRETWLHFNEECCGVPDSHGGIVSF